MQYTGHLDLHKTWERTLRRAGLPLAYSLGFNPQPKIQLAAALPLGHTSECEIVDVWLEAPHPLPSVRLALDRAAPPGIGILDLTEVPPSGPALQTMISAAEYRVTLDCDEPAAAADQRITNLLAASEILRERRGKSYDLRPLIETLSRHPGTGSSITLDVRLRARAGATGRPEEVVAALGWPSDAAAYHRVRLLLTEMSPTWKELPHAESAPH